MILVLWSEMPIGLVISLKAYSATTLFFVLQSNKPIVGLSLLCFKISSTAVRQKFICPASLGVNSLAFNSTTMKLLSFKW